MPSAVFGLNVYFITNGALMSQHPTFADVLDAVGQLDAESQAELVDVVKRRLAEQGRKRIVATVNQARQEFKAGQSQPMTAAEIMQKAQS
jgi:hypothetical protein